MQEDSSTAVSTRRRKSTKKRVSRNKHSKHFQPQPQHPVPAVPENWDKLTITGHVIETGQMVESWFGQMVMDTKTVFTIDADGNKLAQGVDYDTAYVFIQNATKGYRADERRSGLSLLKNACNSGTVGRPYDMVKITKADETYKRRVGGNLTFGYDWTAA